MKILRKHQPIIASMDKKFYFKGALRLSAVCLLVSAAALAANAKIFLADGIYYKTLTANTCEVTANATFKGDLVVPDTVVSSDVKYAVVAIGRGAFNKNGKVTSATLPSTITKIDEWAFSEASGLQRVNIPESVKEIGSSAFQGCLSLREVTVPSKIKTLKSFVFNLCENLTKVNLPEGLTTIQTAAFSACTNLRSLKIPSTVTQIWGIAFWKSGLDTINVPDGIQFIGDAAFCACDNLKKINISRDNEYYTVDRDFLYDKEKSILYCCPVGLNLSSVTVDSSVRTIAEGAFACSPFLNEVILPDSLKEMGMNTFLNCTSLAAIDLPAGMTSIGNSSFSKCTALKTFKFPAALSQIKPKTLYECYGITSITLPDSLTAMGAYSICYCDNLKEVYAPAKTPAVLDPDLEPFFELNMAAITLYVPEESVEAYKAAPVWKDFGKIQGHDFSQGVQGVDMTEDVVPVAYYDLQGRRVGSDSKGVVIIRYSDGSVKKVVLK